MSALDFSSVVVNGGFFLLKQESPVPYAWAPDRGGPCHFVGTYRDSGAPIREALIDAIREAQQRVFVASFMLGDEQVIDEMLRAAERLQGGVYLITALDERSMRRGLQEYEDNEQEAPEERKKNFERLTSGGVYVRGHESCHAKFAVIDDRIAVVGSANFVKNGFEWTGEANLVVREEAAVRQLVSLFTELWFEGCAWEIPPGLTYVVAERASEQSPKHPKTPSGSSNEIVWTNGGGQTSLLAAIHNTIDAAREDLTLSTYSIFGMHQNPALLVDHVYRAIDRGVRVRVFVRQRNAWPDQMEELVALHAAGAKIHADVRNHAKVAIADDTVAVLFSANFDAKHGLDSGVEGGVRIDDKETVHELSRYMNHVIDHADTEFVHNPTLADLNGRLAARWCKDWKGNLDVRVRCNLSEFSGLVEHAKKGPCLFERTDRQVRFYVGRTILEGEEYGGTITASPSPEEISQSAADRLKDWLKSVRDRGKRAKSERGFFPGRMILDETTD